MGETPRSTAGEYCDAGVVPGGVVEGGPGEYAGGRAGTGGRADGVASDTGAYVGGGREYRNVAGGDAEVSALTTTTKGSSASGGKAPDS